MYSFKKFCPPAHARYEHVERSMLGIAAVVAVEAVNQP